MFVIIHKKVANIVNAKHIQRLKNLHSLIPLFPPEVVKKVTMAQTINGIKATRFFKINIHVNLKKLAFFECKSIVSLEKNTFGNNRNSLDIKIKGIVNNTVYTILQFETTKPYPILKANKAIPTVSRTIKKKYILFCNCCIIKPAK